MFKKIFFAIFLVTTSTLSFYAQADEYDRETQLIFGDDPKDKFSYYHPTYFIFGKDDLKLQFSGKYRLANDFALYLGYTQTMFWNIYYTSQPFKDISYNPEMFYRIVEKDNQVLKSLDLGFIHRSNGKDGLASRSVNRIFVKTNLVTKIGRHRLVGDLMFYNIITKEYNNRDIRKYMGYWDFTFYLTDLIVHEKGNLTLQVKINAGEKVYDTNMGGRTIGLIYQFGSDNFNPAAYLQYYSGKAENLLEYNKNTDQVRLGLLLFL